MRTNKLFGSAAGTTVLTAALAVGALTPVPARAQDGTFKGNLLAEIKARPRTVVAILYVLRNRKFLQVVNKVSNPNIQTDFLIRGEDCALVVRHPEQKECKAFIVGLSKNRNGQFNDYRFETTLNINDSIKGDDGKAIGYATLTGLSVAPKMRPMINRMELKVWPTKRDAHPAMQIQVPIKDK